MKPTHGTCGFAMRRKEPRPPLDLETVVIVHGCGCRMAGKTHPELNVCCSEHFIWWPEHPAYIADLFYTAEEREQQRRTMWYSFMQELGMCS